MNCVKNLTRECGIHESIAIQSATYNPARFLGIDDTTAMAYITIVYPLFIRATSGINEIFIINHEDILLLSIFIGILTGISNGIIFKTGLNNGGYGVLSKIISNKKKASITKSNMIINSIIVLITCYC